MFYSQSLLSKKGPLGTIWLAAYFYRKLKKEQVAQTNIVSSVEMIIPEVEISHRILSQLLLGIVRIYSKKVEFLYHDCTEAMNKISKEFIRRPRHVVNKIACAHKNGKSAVADVTDNVFGSAHGNPVNSQPEISPEERMLAPYRHLTISIPERFELDSFDLDAQEECADTSANQRSILEAKDGNDGTRQFNSNEHYHMDLSRGRTFNYSPYTPVEDILSRDVINVDINILDIDSLGILESTTGEFQSNIKPAAKNSLSGVKRCLNLSVVDDDDDSRNNMVNLNETDTDLTVQKGGQPTTSRPTGSHGPPDFAAKTPDKKEGRRFSTKRRCTFDHIIVLPNKVLNEWIHDSTGLTYKRRKVALSSLDAWNAFKFSDLQKAFVEPLIPSALSSLDAWKACKFSDLRKAFVEHLIPYQPVKRSTDSVPERTVADKFADINIGSDTAQPEPPGENETPYHENAASSISLPQCSIETQLDANFDEEPAALQIDISDKDADHPLEGANYEGCFSTRTRSVAQYLHKYFLNLKDGKQNETAILAKILDGGKRFSCAKFFYEVLVLKTNEYIDVIQEHPYGDITISSTARLNQL